MIASDEPHERPTTIDEMKREIATWGLVAPYVTRENAPILAAVLAEVAEQEATGGRVHAPFSLEWNIMKAATYVRVALRLSKGGV